jgi:hypothetical protein
MNDVTLNLPTFGFVIGTRIALGVGIGLLLAERLTADRRRRLGGALLAFGAATTVPALQAVRRSIRRAQRRPLSPVEHDERLIGATRFARRGDHDL